MIIEERHVDRRVRRTKRLLKDSFIKLMKEKDYRHITVTDIVERADYNRATFYLHYKYKEELAEEIVDDMINGLMNSFEHFSKSAKSSSSYTLSPSDISLFDYILEHSDFFILLKDSESIPSFQEKLIYSIENLLKDRWALDPNPIIKSNLLIIFQAYGIAGLVYEWIKSDFSTSPHLMSEQLINIMNYHFSNLCVTN